MSEVSENPTAVERWLLSALRGVMVFFGLALAFLMLTTVIMRYGMSNPFLAIEEAAVLLGVWLYFVSAAYVTGKRAHICGGALHLVVKNEQGRRYVRLMTSLLCLFVVGISFYFAWKYGWFTFEKGRKSPYLQWPRAMWVGGMVFGFTVMMFFFVMQALRDFRACLAGKEAV
ncbi:MAG: TRAP transporter small permease [Qingshengfaniella sp.]